jgi:ATP-dependent Clp protease ATP-binding subunit ClpC
VGTEHLLLGLLREEKGIAAQVLTDAGVNLDAARAETLRLLGTEMPQTGTPATGTAQTPQSTPSTKGEKKSKTPALDHFCRDLTQLAAEGQLDPTIGRAKEIERVMEVLTRRKKNNPVLIGSRAWARRRSSRVWHSSLQTGRARIRCATTACCHSTWRR